MPGSQLIKLSGFQYEFSEEEGLLNFFACKLKLNCIVQIIKLKSWGKND